MKIKIAILGTGHIARDLYRKINFDTNLELFLVSGRNHLSEGSIEAKRFSKHVFSNGIDSIIERRKNIDVVIDCTSAEAHINHSKILNELDLAVIDLTPSGIGKTIIPTINLCDCNISKNINLVSCGGQSSIPILFKWSSILKEKKIKLKYVEVASTISTKSAGLATRKNIDSYIKNTESAISSFCKCESKVILNVNPAEPPVTMKTSFSALLSKSETSDIDWVSITREAESDIQRYVPGYRIVVEPKVYEGRRLFSSALIKGKGDYLPEYSGNLDIITSAATLIASHLK